MTWASPRSMPKAAAGLMRASMHVRTRYFFAGGRAREPEVKVEAYLSEAAERLDWIEDMMARLSCGGYWILCDDPVGRVAMAK